MRYLYSTSFSSPTSEEKRQQKSKQNTFNKHQKVIKYFWQIKSKISLKDYVKRRKINKSTGTGFLKKHDGIKNVKCIGGSTVAIQIFDTEHDRWNSSANKYAAILLCCEWWIINGIVQ